MSIKHGRSGFITVGTMPANMTVLNVSGWTLDEKVELQEDTELNTAAPADRTYNGDGLPDNDITLEFVADTAGLAIAPGNTFTVTLHSHASAGGTFVGNSIAGQIDVTDVSWKEERGDLQRYTLNGKLGALTRLSDVAQ